MKKKLIEVALPLDAINVASAKEKSIRHGHPSTLHLWWVRRPLATCRAVLFGQLVDDPSSWPDLFPTEADQDQERQRLFRIIEAMVPWKASNDEQVIHAARKEIATSIARHRKADGEGNKRDDEVLSKGVKPEVVNKYLAEVAPPVQDPFAGGGSIPLEAQRLGLRAIASDLNPVAVLINKALIEIPPKFAGMPPVNPNSIGTAKLKTWQGAQGLAEDIRYYGEWIRNEAWKKIGHLYPEVSLPGDDCRTKRGPIAWLWVRTVPSPDPALKGIHVPLASSFWLGTKKGKEKWVEIVIEDGKRGYTFEVREGAIENRSAIASGTKVGRGGNFRCVLSGAPIPVKYIRHEASAGRLGARLMAIAVRGNKGRVYISPSREDEIIAEQVTPTWFPEEEINYNPRDIKTQIYGICRYGDLFTPRQLVAMTCFSDLALDVRKQIKKDLRLTSAFQGGIQNGLDIEEYSNAIAVYLGLAVSKSADYWSSLTTWHYGPKMEALRNVFSRQAIPMAWDYAECNPFSNSSGNWTNNVTWTARSLESVPSYGNAEVAQKDAATLECHKNRVLASTDPPYYHNIGYADLSDFFYVWLRRSLRDVYPELFSTMLVPKMPELVATPYRFDNQDAADTHFLDGLSNSLKRLQEASDSQFPLAVYYAVKQAETKKGATVSTGWETFLQALMDSGFSIRGTWPVRTELSNKIGMKLNLLASSIVVVCRKRSEGASVSTRIEFLRALKNDLPNDLKHLQRANIAPVDMAQVSIGPGMAIFSRHAKVIEADGSPMTVRAALQLINQTLDEYLAEQTGEFGPDTRFAVTWFETHGFGTGPYGEAETLATARNVSVQGIREQLTS